MVTCAIHQASSYLYINFSENENSWQYKNCYLLWRTLELAVWKMVQQFTMNYIGLKEKNMFVKTISRCFISVHVAHVVQKRYNIYTIEIRIIFTLRYTIRILKKK